MRNFFSSLYIALILFHTFSEDPNNRSSKDVQHLGPATDFYKRLALDCSGQQIAVDLFLLNSQYSDLSTLCEFQIFSTINFSCLISPRNNFSWNK